MSNDPQRPTINWKRTERPAPTPTPARQDTGSHPGRKVDREAYTYGIHVSQRSGLPEIKARKLEDDQIAAGDAMTGSSYMWDARSPTSLVQPFKNPMHVGEEGFDSGHTPSIYLTRAPSSTVFHDMNTPGKPSLRVAGNQEIIESIPYDPNALAETLKKHGIETRSFEDDDIEIARRMEHPQVKRDLAEQPLRKGEEVIRTLIREKRPGIAARYPDMMKLDHNAPLAELLKEPSARNLFQNHANLEPKDLDKMIDRGHIGIQFDDY